MKIKTFFTVMLIIFWGYGNLQASPSTIMEIPAEPRAKMITAWLSQELKLDKTAEKKVHQINLKYAHLNQQELNTYGFQRTTMRKIKANNAAKDLELKSIFTPEQYETYLEKKKDLLVYLKEKLKSP